MNGKISPTRWLKHESYDEAWISRSRILLELLEEADVALPSPLCLAEFGCGANAPFFRLAAELPETSVRKFDLKAWDQYTRVVDLNNDPFPNERFDVATFSGVLEYLDDVRGVLVSALKTSEFVLFSYACRPKRSKEAVTELIDLVKRRVMVNGWRNHYTFDEILSLASHVGTIVNIGHWRGQVLIVLQGPSRAT